MILEDLLGVRKILEWCLTKRSKRSWEAWPSLQSGCLCFCRGVGHSVPYRPNLMHHFKGSETHFAAPDLSYHKLYHYVKPPRVNRDMLHTCIMIRRPPRQTDASFILNRTIILCSPERRSGLMHKVFSSCRSAFVILPMQHFRLFVFPLVRLPEHPSEIYKPSAVMVPTLPKFDSLYSV